MPRDKILIADPKLASGPATADFVPNSNRLGAGPPGLPPTLALAAEIALQRTHLEVTPEIGFDSLRRGDGP